MVWPIKMLIRLEGALVSREDIAVVRRLCVTSLASLTSPSEI